MFTVRFPAWAWMWGISLVMFGGLKLLSWSARTVTAAPGRHVAYLAGWPGMDADSFLGTGRGDRPALREWVLGCLKLLVGAGLIAGLHLRVVDDSPIVAGAIGMAGIVLVLHFGLFHLLSCLWRTFGVNAAPIMNCPVAARSLAEFWGRRWNLAFRDLSHRFLFRPLARQMPPAVALLAGFVVSGLVHDLVISVPAQGGWGGPTLYFTFQGVAILMERSIAGRRWGLGHGRRGWCFTAAVVILPSPLLFHPPFLVRVINPFLHACGA